nr:SDR family NAD(P)-dependent oxidoreductase [Nocardia suismassiliense]
MELPRAAVQLPDRRLLAGVTSFGASGSNVHLVLSSPPPVSAPEQRPDRSEVLVLSARTRPALRALAEAYRTMLHVDGSRVADVGGICAGAAIGRRHMEWRLAGGGERPEQMAEGLTCYLSDEQHPRVWASQQAVLERPRIVFVFPGQGSQWPAMGRELRSNTAVFAEALADCDRAVVQQIGWSLIDAVDREDTAWPQLTNLVQPALWAMGTALARTWRAWGIEPDAVVGQSQGEVAAAHVAGALSTQQAATVVCARAQLAARLCPPGAMALVQLRSDAVEELLNDQEFDVSVAVINSPSSTVVSGAPTQIDLLDSFCRDHGVDCQIIPVDYAAHSAMVDIVREPLQQELAGLRPADTTTPMYSTVTGTVIAGTELGDEYWWRNLREPVRLAGTLAAAIDVGPTVVLQVSPHPLLTPAIEEIGAATATPVTALGSLRRDQPQREGMLGSLAALYAMGCSVNWAGVYGDTRRVFDLPHYPWQHTQFWHQAPSCPWPALGSSGEPTTRSSAAPPAQTMPVIQSATNGAGSVGISGDHHNVADALSGTTQHVRSKTLDHQRDRFLLDHRVAGRSVMPGAGFVDAALSAVAEVFPDRPITVERAEFVDLLPLDAADLADIELTTSIDSTDRPIRLTVASALRSSARTVNMRATVRSDSIETSTAIDALAQARGRCTRWQAGEQFYREHARSGNEWAGAFRGITEMWRGSGEVVTSIRAAATEGYRFHPAALDACLQTAFAVMISATKADGRGGVLVGVEEIQLLAPRIGGPLWCHARTATTNSEPRADVTVFDASQTPVARLIGVRARLLSSSADSPARPESTATVDRYRIDWQQASLAQRPSPVGAWLVISNGGEQVRALGDRFATAGATVLSCPSDSDATEISVALAQLPPGTELAGAIYLAALSDGIDAGASEQAVQWVAADLCTGLRNLALVLQEAGRTTTPVVVVTRGAQAAAADPACPAPWQAALWGLAPVLGQEQHRSLTCVDLDPATVDPVDDADRILSVLSRCDNENRLAVRRGRWYVPRLVPAGAAPKTSAAPDAQSDAGGKMLRSRGGSDALEWVDCPRPLPAAGQVEIEVSHVGLNFLDVLTLTGLEPDIGHRHRIGLECAGVVRSLGAGVHDFAVGDAVITFLPDGTRSHVVVDARMVVPRPANISAAQAAAIPIAYCTAYHALVERAAVTAGERVLIHSASGGLGMAALHIAHWRGATVYGTAGDEARRQFVRRLGAADVGDSRSVGFAAQFRRHDRGQRGTVDVILNTLIGDAVEANFSLLDPLFGRYADVTNAADGHRLAVSLLSHGRGYLHVDALDFVEHAPDRAGQLLHTVVDLISNGTIDPPECREFALAEASEAFGLIMRAGHTGKLVLALPPTSADRTAIDGRHTAIRKDASYLVTGGLSGLGELCAQWLIDRGATTVVLTGRQRVDAEATDDPKAAALQRLRTRGAKVEYADVDVADYPAMAALLDRLDRAGLPPIAGVVHSAAVLNPANIIDLTPGEIDSTLRPKVAGTWVLHKLFGDKPLDFFVLFSSGIAFLAGTTIAHQLGAYAAANAFVEALADHRRSRGLPATAVDWGYWSQVGLAARLSAAAGKTVRPTGMHPIHPENAPLLFDDMLRQQHRMIHLPANWGEYRVAYPQDAAVPLLQELLSTDERHREHQYPPSAGEPLSERNVVGRPTPTPVAVARSSESGHSIAGSEALEQYLVEQIASVIGLAVADLDRSRPLNRLGLDSLMAADVRSRLLRDHQIELTVPQLLAANSIHDLAATLAPPTAAGLDSLMAADVRSRLLRDHQIELTVPQLLAANSIHDLAATLAPPTAAADRVGALG